MSLRLSSSIPWRRPARAIAVGLASSLMSLGCGGSDLVSVSGTVTYNGQPVPRGTISFQPVDPAGRIATGAIESDGSYSLQTEEPGDGALPGEYGVVISAVEKAPVLDYIPSKPVKPKYLIPQHYADPAKSGLKATVEAGKSNEIPFDLK